MKKKSLLDTRNMKKYEKVSFRELYIVPNVVLHIVAVLVISTVFWSNAALTKE